MSFCETRINDAEPLITPRQKRHGPGDGRALAALGTAPTKISTRHALIAVRRP